jgi:ferredoxin
MSKTVTKPKKPTVKDKAAEERLVPIFVMGKRYEVPASLTIQKALEHAGYLLVRGCGCRGGICGACGTVFRYPHSYRIEVGLACQTVVQPDMYIAQIPFFPGNKAVYDIETLAPVGATIAALYPEIFKCVGCGTCTRSCPMDIDVLSYVSKAIQGDISGVADGSFDCVMCGLCAARCPAEVSTRSDLARRLRAWHLMQGRIWKATRLAAKAFTPQGSEATSTAQEAVKPETEQIADNGRPGPVLLGD